MKYYCYLQVLEVLGILGAANGAAARGPSTSRAAGLEFKCSLDLKDFMITFMIR